MSLGSIWFENCMNHLNDAIFITDAEPFDDSGPKIFRANDIFYQITGYEPSEVIGKTPRILKGPLFRLTPTGHFLWRIFKANRCLITIRRV